MKEEKKKDVEIKSAGIDSDVLDIMKEEDVLKAISDEVQIRRVMLNFFCEMLSQVKELKKEFEDFYQTISICSTDKVIDFFKKLKSNVEEEKTRIAVKEKIKKSHLKSKKSNNTVVKFPKDNIK